MFLKSFTCKIAASSNKIIFRKLNKDYNHGFCVPGGLTTNRHYCITNSNTSIANKYSKTVVTETSGTSANFTTNDNKFEHISLLSIKKTIKASGLEARDGFCCIETECPVCDPPNATAKNPHPLKTNVYVNKTTGT